MSRSYRDIARHSVVYGLAHIAIRAASFLLLPFYTRHLRPADYGCMAILDLTANLLALLVGSGIASATSRYHFDADDEAARDRVWWTGWAITAVLALTIILPAWVSRDTLAQLTLGPEVALGPYYYLLALPTLWFTSLGEVPGSYIQVRKWSSFFMVLVVGRLLLNIILNVYFVGGCHMGVSGILLGNLIVAGLNAAILSAVMLGSRGRFAFSWHIAGKILRFGWPMTVAALLVMVMHQADRYLLRLYLPLDRIGIYALAYTIGEGVNTLILAPFVAIWGVAIYEIAKQPDAKRVYARVFRHYVDIVLLIMLGVSLFARPILGLMAARDFAGAADLIPIICLAYVLFSLSEHFKVPALLTNRTVSLLPASFAAASLNVALNLMFIPRMGTFGAAWVTVATFAAYSFIGLWRYRLIDRYDYPLVRSGAVLTGMIATYVGFRSLGRYSIQPLLLATVAAMLWLLWAIVLFARPAWAYFVRYHPAMAVRMRRSDARLAAEILVVHDGP